MGRFFAALLAGYRPKRTPINPENPTAAQTTSGAMEKLMASWLTFSRPQ